jgi:uncharacterized protein YkwD
LAAAYPTSYEQYMVELINKARATPDAYAASLGISLNEGLAAGTISSTAKQPLAINPYLTDSAANHSQWMLDFDTFSHTGASGSSPTSRMQAAGYVLESGWSTGENIAYRGTTGTPNVAAFTKALAESLFIDASVSGRGHRLNIMKDAFVEVGAGIRTGTFGSYNSVMVTEDFGKSAPLMFLTGVAFNDIVTVDNFYTPGEGLNNVSIVAIRDGNGARYSTTTWASGGYNLALPRGRYSIMAKSAALGPSQFIASVNIGTQNVKRDFKVGWTRVAPEIAIQGNSAYVPNNDTTPRTVDNTDFGSTSFVAGSITKTFSVVNFGNATLNLTGAQRVAISGANASDFVVTSQPGTTVAGESSSAFAIKFDPSASGLRTAVVTVTSDDANESTFSFTIVGTGTDSPAMLTAQGSSTSQSASASAMTSSPSSSAALPSSSSTLGRFSVESKSKLMFEQFDLRHYVGALDLPSLISSAGPRLGAGFFGLKF